MNKEFNKVLTEFIPDLLECFPEYKDRVHDGVSVIIKNFQPCEESEDFDLCISDDEQNTMNLVYEHSKSVIPERFFDILYKNDDIFQNKEYNTEFIIGIKFNELWNHSDMTETTKEIIWKYLQLFLFSIVSDMKDGNNFGDTAKLFEAINETEFKTKLEDTMEEMQSFFEELEKKGKDQPDTESNNSDDSGDKSNSNSSESDNSNNTKDIPDPDKIHDHIQSMMGGKIGCLAKEIAEETMKDMDINLDVKDGENMSPDSLFKQLFRDPSKLMNITKNIGSKLETRMKDGDIKEEDLMQEASEMMTKMKEMPGMDQFNDIIKAFGGNMGKMNTKASQNAMSNRFQQMSMRQRMKDILKQRQENKQNTVPNNQPTETLQIQNESSHVIEGEGKNKVFKVSDPGMVQTKSKRPNKKKRRGNKKKGNKN